MNKIKILPKYNLFSCHIRGLDFDVSPEYWPTDLSWPIRTLLIVDLKYYE